MRIGFDPAKDLVNQAKHEASLAMAVELDWEAVLVWVDNRFDYSETVAQCEGSSACAAPIVVR